MPIIKCKMCGGDLEILENSTVCECEYCGTKQTVPKVDDEKKLKLFERANRLRSACEFDKAAGVYETIIADFDQEAEAYWGLILCKFGIEYVDDPATGNKVPTCHRSSFDSLMDDPNFDMVMECADPIARRVYRDEAKAIEELRKRIIEVSSKEEPYDVFISYKELDDNGERTLDSVIAQDVYTELTDKGYRAFFSRISLEDKLGVEYEPYIFAALNSAKVMLVVGTDYDYFNAVWVKNEWSRFLALIASGQKKTLIPVFKGIDAYDMPKEFAKLAAQDMGKVGAMQDLVRGVEKIIGKKQTETTPAPQPVQQVVQQVVQGGGPNVQALLDRGNMALEDEDWEKASSLFDQVLNMDVRNAEAYLGLALSGEKCSDPEQLIDILCDYETKAKTIIIERSKEQKEEIKRQFCLPFYLERDKLSEMLDQHEEYSIIAEHERESAAKARERFSKNRDLTRAFRFAEGDSKAKLDRLSMAFEARLNARIEAAEKADKKAEQEAHERLASVIEEANQAVAEAYQLASKRIEDAYQNACRILNKESNSNELASAVNTFDRIQSYRDSEQLRKEAENKRKEASFNERVTQKIEVYQKKIMTHEKELPSTPLLKRGKLKQEIKWYQNEIEKLKKEKEK